MKPCPVSVHLVTPLLLVGCRVAEAPATPAEAFAALEERCLASGEVEVQFEISATGAVESLTRGALVVAGDHVEFTAEGTFMGWPTRVEMSSAGRYVRGGDRAEEILGPTPPGFREGVLVGLTRMGLLHVVSALRSGQLPAGMNEDVRTWARARGFGPVTGGIQFELAVDGQPAGRAVLRLSDGVPTVREHVIPVGDGEIKVTETYTSFALR